MTNTKEIVSTLYRGILTGHSDWVTALACPHDPTTNILVSAGRDKRAIVWDLVKTNENYGIAKQSLNGHNHFIQDLTLSVDGTHAITASWDNTLRLWDLEGSKSISTFVGHTNGVMSVSPSPDGRQIVSGSRDKTIRVWNTNGKHECTLDEKGHTHWVSCTRFSPDSNSLRLVSCGWDKLVKVWNMDRKCLSLEHTGHTEYINFVAVSPDGSLCASGGKDGKILLWDLVERCFSASFDIDSEIYSLAFNPSRYWLSATTSLGIKTWDLLDGKLIAELTPEPSQTLNPTSSTCISTAWSCDGSTLFAGYKDGGIRIWEFQIDIE